MEPPKLACTHACAPATVRGRGVLLGGHAGAAAAVLGAEDITGLGVAPGRRTLIAIITIRCRCIHTRTIAIFIANIARSAGIAIITIRVSTT